MKQAMTVFMVLIAFSAIAAAAELSAAVAEPDASYYYVSNCKGAGDGPTQVQARFIVTNNWNIPMTVRYSYYDYGTDEWVDGNTQICTIAANLPASDCTVTAPLRLGGRGNGTMANAPFLRLRGMDPDGKQDSLSKEFAFKFEHFSADSEISTMGKIRDLHTRISELEASGACGPASTDLEGANTALMDAETALKKCDLHEATVSASDSLNALSKYTEDPASICTVPAPTEAPKPELISETPEAPVPNATPAPETTATPAAGTASEGGSACAIGLALPLLGLLAMWRRAA